MKRFIVALFGILACVNVALAQNVRFTASSQPSVVVGNPFQLQYQLNEKGENLRAPAFDGFRHMAGPTVSSSQQMSYVNGRVSKSVSYTYSYVLAAKKAGTYSIPAATVEVKGKKYTSNPVTIRVLAQETQAAKNSETKDQYGISNKDLFVRATVSKTNTYLSDALVYTLKLYSRGVTVAPDIGGEVPNFDGFLSFEIEPDDRQSGIVETYNGLNYRTYVLKQTLLYPQKSGNLVIDPAKLKFNIKIRTRRRNVSIFDDLFDTFQNVQKNLNSNEVKVKVNKLPQEGRPDGFANLVGKFKLASTISTQSVKANEPVTLKITVSGNGNLKLLGTPKIKFPADFEVYDPKVANNYNTSVNGVSGSRTFEYLVIPRFAGEFTIPSYKLSYFDVSAKKYVTKATPDYVITVAKGDDSQQNTVVSSFANKEDVKFIGQDIRYIKTENVQLRQRGVYLFGSQKYWLFYILSTLLFLTVFVVYRKRIKDNANVSLMRNKKANKVARKNLKNAYAFMQKDNPEQFYEEVLRALWGYTGDKLDIPISELNRDNITTILQKYGIDESAITQFKTLLDTCEFARYAPTAVTGGMDETYEQAISLISQLDNKIRKAK